MTVIVPHPHNLTLSNCESAGPAQIGSPTASDALIYALLQMGAQFAFGMIGGAIVPFYEGLLRTPLQVVNFRHESGATYAALEAALALDSPAIAFATTGPGLTNALTGALAARWEGAKLLLVSGYTSGDRRGRFALQESNGHALTPGIYTSGGLFDYAAAIEHEAELPTVIRALSRGFGRARGFVAHVAMPLAIQARPAPSSAITIPATEVAASDATMAEVRARLREPFAIWVGYGARHAAAQIRKLLERTNAPVLATPRGKGIVSELDPRYLGVSGIFGSEPELSARIAAAKVERILVLGSRLGEVSSGYDAGLIPRGGLIHVDLDPDVPGSAFPRAPTFAVQAEIGQFVECLLGSLEARPRPVRVTPPRPPARMSARDRASSPWCNPSRRLAWSFRRGRCRRNLQYVQYSGVSAPSPRRKSRREATRRITPRAASPRVRPQYLMQCLQDRVVEGSPSVILAESGNAFAWATRHLRFTEPNRYRQSGLFCPMGHVSAGVLGVALATRRRAVAVVGDGAFLMQNEISTAVQLGAEVTWVVLNDARYGMVDQGLRAYGHAEPGMDFPSVDFVTLAWAFGADGARVEHESQLVPALELAMGADGPFVLDVVIDTKERAPFGGRIRSILEQTKR